MLLLFHEIFVKTSFDDMKIAHSLLSDFGILVNPIPIKGTDRFRPPHDYLSPPQIFKHSAGSEMYAMFDEFRTK